MDEMIMEIMGIIKGVPLKSTLLFILNLLLIFPRDVTSAQLNFVSYNCPVSSNYTYTLDSAFRQNLNLTLLSILPANASLSSARFSTFSIGQGIDRVYALYMCRGDIDAETCQDCVKTAAIKLVDRCQPLKEGIAWYQECLVRYANRTIFPLRDLSPKALYTNYTSMWSSDRLGRYKDKIDTAMDALFNKTAFNLSLKGFDTTEIKLSSSQTLHGLAQCTPDILSTPCQTCLNYAYKQQDSRANTQIFLPSCLIMFDLYGSPLPPVQPGAKSRKMILIVVPIIVAVFLLLGGFYFWKRYCHPRPGQQQSESQIADVPREEQVVSFEDIYTEPRTVGLRKFSYSEVESMTNGFLKRLGEGGYGYVYYGSIADGSRSKEVAIKVLTKDAPKQFSTEIAVLGKISHKNLVSLIGYCEEPNHLALVYEYMAIGDLKFLLSGSDRLSWKKRLQIAIDSAQGLDYLHNGCKPAIVHRDVKTPNILLNQNLRAKIADFGFSKIFPDEHVSVLTTRVIGTPGYLDPQYHLSGQLNERSDVYSFGVVLLELITGKDVIVSKERTSGQKTIVQWVRPFLERGDLENIVDLRLPQVQSRSSLWRATDLAMECVKLNATERPAMSQIVTELKECLAMEIDDKSSFAGRPNSMEIMNLQFSSVMGPTAR